MSPPRRRPFPYDINIGGVGLMLVKGRDAPLVGTKAQAFDQQHPTDFKYESLPPYAERTQPFDDLSLGFGLKVQNGFADHKYRYATNADLSVGGLWLKGPDIATLTPATRDSSNGIGQLVEMGGVIYATNGRYILKRVNDASWTAVDLGLGKTAYQQGAAVFASGGGSTTLLYVPLLGGDKAVYFDGTTATPMATFQSLAYASVGSEFWRASDTNALNKVDRNSDPTVEANYGALFRVGDKTSPIMQLAVTATGTLVVLKRDGIYSLEGDGTDHKLFGALAFGTTTEDGRYVGAFGNDLYTPYQETLYRVVPTVVFGATHLELEEIGPEKLTENDSPVRGRVTAFAGDGAHGAYAGLYSDDTGNGHLLKFGSWMTAEIAEGQLFESKRIDSWHGALASFTGKAVVALLRSTVGAPTGHARMYVGFSDGTVGWFTLPCVPNPAGCSQYTFTTSDAHVYLPLWHGTFEADAKSLRAFSVLGLNLSTANKVQLNYKTDPNASAYTALGTDFTTAPRQRALFPPNTFSYLADLDVVLVSTGTGSCPQVQAVVPHYAARPSLVREYRGAVNANDGLVARDGRPLRRSGPSARSAVYDAASSVGAVTVVLPTEESKQLSFTDYSESLSWDERLRGYQAAVAWRAVEYETNTLYGTVGRLGPYLVSDLAPFTVTQLGTL